MKSYLLPYLLFPENTKGAMEFYQSIFGGKLDITTYKDAGFPHEEKDDDKVIHSELKSDIVHFMASEADETHPVKMGTNFYMSLMGDNEPELKGLFDKLSEGGKVEMELQKQFWGDVYGQLVDKFGTKWTVNISSGEQKQTPS